MLLQSAILLVISQRRYIYLNLAVMSNASPDFDKQRSDASGFRFAIVVSRWNSLFTDRLLSGAEEALLQNGATKEDIEVFKVPGAFELPLACLKAAESGRYDAVIALGVVIRGDTPHFDYVAGQSANGIMQAGLQSGIPVMFGVITTDNEQQTIERCGKGSANKGYEAAISAIEIANLFREMAQDQGRKGKEKSVSHVV
jgi:6,7-dimethyl-8-ribityllumazine synthase